VNSVPDPPAADRESVVDPSGSNRLTQRLRDIGNRSPALSAPVGEEAPVAASTIGRTGPAGRVHSTFSGATWTEPALRPVGASDHRPRTIRCTAVTAVDGRIVGRERRSRFPPIGPFRVPRRTAMLLGSRLLTTIESSIGIRIVIA
jgi:hypothetical protein